MPTSENSKPGRALQAIRPAPRRQVSVPDYVMPKPYRKQVFASEMRTALPSAQIVLVGGVVILIAGLVFMLALMARAYFDGKRHAGVPPKERARPARIAQVPVPPAQVNARPRPRIAGPVRPAAIKVAKKAAAMPQRPNVRTASGTPAGNGQSVARSAGSQPAQPALPPAPVIQSPQDPDADVIALILTLFPQPTPAPRGAAHSACVTAADKARGCEQAELKKQ